MVVALATPKTLTEPTDVAANYADVVRGRLCGGAGLDGRGARHAKTLTEPTDVAATAPMWE
ncbi:hypothetical protein PF003_g30983 [Phytophthora fragariae]|nr:hypothetical protein PF003_g30983 [Phytophthora fragariae]